MGVLPCSIHVLSLIPGSVDVGVEFLRLMNSSTFRSALVLVGAIIGLSAGSSLRGQLTALDFDTSVRWSTGGGVNVYGWQFSLHTSIEVTSVGLFDDASRFDGGFPGDGFLEPHVLGIWESSKPTPLITEVLLGGTTEQLIEGFRYVDIEPLLLRGGQSYIIAASYHNGDLVVGTTNNPTLNLVVSPHLSFDGYRFGNGDSILAVPENFRPGRIEGIGPNFRYTPVPEPATLPFVLTGIAILVGGQRWVRRSRKSTYPAGG